jgi:hypothetical protein
MSIKLSGILPRDLENNGLERLSGDVLVQPTQTQMVVASLVCSQIARNPSKDSVTITLRVKEIEAFAPGDKGWTEAQNLLVRQQEWRTGRVPLPLDANL